MTLSLIDRRLHVTEKYRIDGAAQVRQTSYHRAAITASTIKELSGGVSR
jgi:hypothetical protein